MARQRKAVQINQFIGGLNTEANPLTFPENASVEEVNMELLRDGSRKRRPGFDVEVDAEFIDSGIVFDANVVLGRSQFLWENPGGYSDKQFIVIQIGNYLAFHDLDVEPLSSATKYSTTYSSTVYENIFSYASVDGYLVVATGLKQVSVYSYDGTNITKTDETLLIRDLFGVESTDGTDVLTEPLNFQKRPSTLPDTHLYNLRNQTFALPRVEGDANTLNSIDPVAEFYAASGSTLYPSNADSVVRHLLADNTFTTNRTVERFNAGSMFKSPPNNSRAPIGYFIIDALDRGQSRLAEEAELRANQSDLSLSVTTLPDDTTPGGPTVIGAYAGRVWYAGFSSEVINGDSESPRMSSYILFSQLVDNLSKIPNCFQEADPTSNVDPDIVDTDGGFIRIDGAYNIRSLITVGSSMFVIAENGVWRVVGKDENTFNATSFSVYKIGDEGCVGPSSVVYLTDGIMYWGEYGIYLVAQDQTTTDWKLTNLSQDTIQSFYDKIPSGDRVSCVGYFDRYSPAVRWVYGPRDFTQQQQQTYELIFNTKYNVFTLNSVTSAPGTYGSFSVSGSSKIVGTNILRDPKESLYCIIGDFSSTIEYTFGGYNTYSTPRDWARDLVSSSFTGGIDSPAYLITSKVNGGDTRLRKDVPYITTYFQRTDNDPNYPKDSSCIFQSQWDWTTDSLAHKWSSEKQAFRVLRSDVGQNMIHTRNKVRGSGRCVAFKFSSEEDKDMHMYGWEYNIQAGSEE